MQLMLYQVLKDTCIDLTFTSQPNLTIESSVHSSLHPANCHYQIVYAKFNLQIHFASPYSLEIWHCKDKNTELKKGSIQKFNCQKPF